MSTKGSLRGRSAVVSAAWVRYRPLAMVSVFGLGIAITVMLTAGWTGAVCFAADPDSGARPATSDQLQEARDLMVDGQYDQAAQAFSKVLDTDPQNIKALDGLGMAYSREFKLDEADEQFDKVLAIDAADPVAHCGKALVALSRVERNQLGTLTKADALRTAGRECNKALDADPRVVEAHFLLGKVYKEEGRLDLAVQAFTGAIHLDPHYASAYNMLAATQVVKGSLPQAIENYKQSLSINPKNSTANIGLAEIYIKQSRLDDAIASLNNAVNINPNSANAHMLLARTYELKGNTTAALQEYQTTLKARADDLEPYREIARIYETSGEFDSAAGTLRDALKVVPTDTQLRCRLGDDLLRAGNADEALRQFKEVIAAQHDSGDAAIGLSRIFYMKVMSGSPAVVTAGPEFQSSQKLIADAAKASPGQAILHLSDASMRALDGQKIELAQFPPPQNLAERKIYAQLLMSMRRFPEAQAVLATGINSAQTVDDILSAGDTALQLKDLDGAELAFRRAATFSQAQQRARRGLALVSESRETAAQDLAHANILSSTKQYAAAIEKYRAALSADPKQNAARLGLAEALDKNAPESKDPSSDARDAVDQYNAYLALSPALPAREHERIQRRIDKLQAVLTHAPQNASLGWRGLFQRFATH